MNSREKGKRGEREAARAWEAAGLGPARRGQQYSGIEGDDIIVQQGVHVEVKRTERFKLYAALEQSLRDAAHDEAPIVLHRSNGKPWVVVTYLSTLKGLIRKLDES